MITGATKPDEERLMTYLICAELWGWTPEEVDKQPADIIRKLLILSKEYRVMTRQEKRELKG